MTATYYGATAASTLANPPVVIGQTMSGSLNNSPGYLGAKLWFYSSSNASTDISNSECFSDGQALGMQVGDVVLCVKAASTAEANPIVFLTPVIAVSSTGAYTSTAVISSTAV